MPVPDLLFAITEGWSNPLDATLYIAGATFDASTFAAPTVSVRDKNGLPVSIAASWADAANSKARISPTATDFKAALSPYTIQYMVVDGTGKQTFYPRSSKMRIDVAPF